MSKYCRYCGEELNNGRCNCSEFRNGSRNDAIYYLNQRANSSEQAKDPLLSTGRGLNFLSFSAFVTSIRNRSGLISDDENTSNPYERNMAIVPDCIKPEKNEIAIKQYNIVKLKTGSKFLKAEGRLMVTNRRVIFRAAGTSLVGNVVQEHQFNIDEIGGISVNKDYKFKRANVFICLLLYLMVISMFISGALSFVDFDFGVTSPQLDIPPYVSLLVTLLCLVPTFVLYKRFWIKYFFSLVGLVFASTLIVNGSQFAIVEILQLILITLMQLITIVNGIIVCFVPNVSISVKTKGATDAMDISGNNDRVIFGLGRIFSANIGNKYVTFADVLPWEDTQLAINELGTLINDLQKHGDYAIDKWS